MSIIQKRNQLAVDDVVRETASVNREIKRAIGPKGVISAKLPRPVLKGLWRLRGGLYNLPLHRNDQDQSRPSVLQFNVSSICNAKCSFCAYRFVEAREIMGLDIFERGLSEYVGMGGDYIGLNALVGEPLLDRGLKEKLDVCAAQPALKRIEMFTNAILLSRKEKCSLIASSPITHLFISMGPFERTAYARTMGVDRYEEAKSGVKNILTEVGESGSKISVRLMMRGSIDSILTDDFKNEMLPLVGLDFIRDHVQFIELYDSWGGQIKKADLPPGADLMPVGAFRFKPCARMYNMAILPNGDMRLCDCRIGERGARDELIVGNIARNSLAEVWNSEKVESLRRSFSERSEPDVCKKCGFYSPA